MTVAGFTLGSITVVGLIGEVDWSEFEVAVQESTVFGVNGTETLEGFLKRRAFSFPMKLYGWGTPADRDFALMQLETWIGTTDQLNAWVPSGLQIISLDQSRLANIKLGKAGYDTLHGFWREVLFSWEQLLPVSQDDYVNFGGGSPFIGE